MKDRIKNVVYSVSWSYLIFWSAMIILLTLIGYSVLNTKSILAYGGLILAINLARKHSPNINEDILNIGCVSLVTILVVYFLKQKMNNSGIVLYVGLILILLYVFIVCLDKVEFVVNFVVKFRYAVALVIFIICVALQIHGSSINYYNSIFTDLPYNDSTIFGEARSLRSDEFSVQAPYYFSQYYNDYNEISNQMSISGQDMIIGYNAPVKSITTFSKPFTWGYILLGNAYGLSWYWCSKTILCVLVMLELCLILTKNNNKMSIMGSLLIVFSPAMQWWFSPHMYDVFFWGGTLLVVGYHFFVSKQRWKKILTTILAGCSLTGFILALFPSLQIAVGLSMFAFLIGLLIRDKDKIDFTKIDLIRIICVVIIVGISLGSFLLVSKDELVKLYSTVYPGNRISTGGDRSLNDLFSNLMCLITPFKDSNILNNCEIATFNHTGVLFMMSYVYFFYKKGKKNKDIIAGGFLFVIMLVQILFMLIGMPSWLAKITLFSYINRMYIAYGFVATIATIWMVYYYKKYSKELNIKIMGLLTLLYSVACYFTIPNEQFQFLPKYFYIFVVLVVLVILLTKFMKIGVVPNALLIAVIFVSSCTINPISHGIDAIEGHQISSHIKEIVNKDDSYWITTGSTRTQNFLLANGAKTLNAVNFYPDYGKWDLIDEGNKFDNVYNRYAHIIFNLSDEEKYIVNSADGIIVNLTAEDLQKLKVKYILTDVDYRDFFNKHNIKYSIEYKDQTGYLIYKLEY